MRVASAFVPGHISGFFQVCDRPHSLVKKGSRNCGPCIDAGVTTKIRVEESSSPQLEVRLEDRGSVAETTRSAVKSILDELSGTYRVEVEHLVQSPCGAGYGMSGAGALGAALSLSKALDLGLSGDSLVSIAHKAEVTCRSGLGDVGPQMEGGLVIGLEPGVPPYGNLERMNVRDGTAVVCGTEGPFDTSRFLENPEFRSRSEELGESAMEKLLSRKNVRNFMRVSEEFALHLGIFESDFYEILREISVGSPWGASAVMLGRAIFAPTPRSGINDLKDVFLGYFDSGSIMVSEIDQRGARIL